MVPQKMLKLYFQSRFSKSKIERIFSKKNHLRISIRRPFFSKIVPNFWQTGALRILKMKRFPLSTYFWPKILIFRTQHLKNSTIELILLDIGLRNRFAQTSRYLLMYLKASNYHISSVFILYFGQNLLFKIINEINSYSM